MLQTAEPPADRGFPPPVWVLQAAVHLLGLMWRWVLPMLLTWCRALPPRPAAAATAPVAAAGRLPPAASPTEASARWCAGGGGGGSNGASCGACHNRRPGYNGGVPHRTASRGCGFGSPSDGLATGGWGPQWGWRCDCCGLQDRRDKTGLQDRRLFVSLDCTLGIGDVCGFNPCAATDRRQSFARTITHLMATITWVNGPRSSSTTVLAPVDVKLTLKHVRLNEETTEEE